jgi:hypothetical protein
MNHKPRHLRGRRDLLSDRPVTRGLRELGRLWGHPVQASDRPCRSVFEHLSFRSAKRLFFIHGRKADRQLMGSCNRGGSAAEKRPSFSPSKTIPRCDVKAVGLMLRD